MVAHTPFNPQRALPQNKIGKRLGKGKEGRAIASSSPGQAQEPWTRCPFPSSPALRRGQREVPPIRPFLGAKAPRLRLQGMISAGDGGGNWVGDLGGKRVGKRLALGPSVLRAQVQIGGFHSFRAKTIAALAPSEGHFAQAGSGEAVP